VTRQSETTKFGVKYCLSAAAVFIGLTNYVHDTSLNLKLNTVQHSPKLFDGRQRTMYLQKRHLALNGMRFANLHLSDGIVVLCPRYFPRDRSQGQDGVPLRSGFFDNGFQGLVSSRRSIIASILIPRQYTEPTRIVMDLIQPQTSKISRSQLLDEGITRDIALKK
jgi:hypothetical protein